MTHLDAVTDADLDRFEAHPCRCYRPRPTPIAELMPGEVMVPGSHIFAAARSGRLVPRQSSARLPLLGTIADGRNGSFLALEHMRAATALDFASRSGFPEFHTLAERGLTNHILSIDP
jgi:hypothetical protein